MVVHDLGVEGVARPPSEADTPLVIDANAVLARPIAGEPFQSIPRWYPEILDDFSGVEHPELAERSALEIRSPSADRIASEQSLRVAVAEAPDHWQMITRHNMNGKRY